MTARLMTPQQRHHARVVALAMHLDSVAGDDDALAARSNLINEQPPPDERNQFAAEVDACRRAWRTMRKLRWSGVVKP